MEHTFEFVAATYRVVVHTDRPMAGHQLYKLLCRVEKEVLAKHCVKKQPERSTRSNYTVRLAGGPRRPARTRRTDETISHQCDEGC